MHKVLLLLSLFILSFLNAKSQTFKAGAFAGVSTTQVDGDGYGGFNKAGLDFGGFVNTQVSNDLSLQFEIEYMQKGSRKNPDSGAINVDLLILRLDYVQVPILVKYHKKSFHLEGGFYAGILVNFYLEDESGDRTSQFENNPELEQVKSSEFGFLGGLGYDFNETFGFNTRFSQTLGNVKRYDSRAFRWLDSGWRNIVVSFTFRYTFSSRG